MSSQDNFARGMLIGTLIGGAIGAVTALLFAPKSGVELRADIAKKSNELYDNALDIYGDVERNLNRVVINTVNQGKEKAEGIVSTARNEAEKLLKNAESILKDAKSKASSAKEQVEERIADLRDAAKASAETFKAELNKDNVDL